ILENERLRPRSPAVVRAVRSRQEYAVDRQRQEFAGHAQILSGRRGCRFLAAWPGWAWLWSRIDRFADCTGDRILEFDSIMVQSARGRTVQLNFRLFVDGHGGDQIEFSEGEIALRGHGLESRSCSQCLLSL